MFLLGFASAVVASALFNIGVALQALEARTTPRREGLRVALLFRLLRRWRWLLGLGLGLAGVAPQVLAFATAPFVVVQTTLVAGLLLLLFLGSRMLDEPVGRAEWAGVAAIIAGVALVSWGAPDHTETHRGGLAVVAVIVGLLVPALAPFAVRGTRADTAMLAIVASGCGFAATNVATKLLSDDFGVGHYGNAAAWAVIGLGAGIAATITGMTAFQRTAATIVVPVSTTVQTFLPIALEPLFLRESWDSANAGGVVIALGTLITFAGTVTVSRTRNVSTLVAGAQGR